MSKVETAGRSLMRLSYMSALVAAVGVAVLAGFVESQRREAFRQATRSDVLDRLALLRTQIQGAVDSNVRLVTGLVAVVEFQPDIDRAQFTRLATRLIRGRTQIRAIAVAPDLVVSILHPLEGN